MTPPSSRITRVSAQVIARSSLLAMIALTPLAGKEPQGSLRDQKRKQEAACLRLRAETKPAGQTPALPAAFRSAPVPRASRATAVAAKYTLSQLSAMSYADLVNTLAGISWEDVTDLWTFSSSAQTFYGDSSRVQALIDAIASRSAAFTATDNKGIPTLVEVVRAGFYHGWYHTAELPAMNDSNTHDKCLPAIRQAQANPNFTLRSAAGCDVIAAMGILIANASCDPGIVRGFQGVLGEFNANFDTYAADHAKGTAWFNVCSGIDSDLYNDVRNNGNIDPATLTQWYGQINYTLEEVFTTANKPVASYTSANAWAIDAAIYYTSRMGQFHGTPNRALQVITDAMNRYGKNPWKYASAQAAQMIHFNYKDVDYAGNKLNWPQIQEEIRAQYLPQTRSFDGGLFTSRYGNNVPLEKMKTLIWAHKETRAQFFRTIGADAPVDPNQTSDNSLQIIVYNSPDEYRMNGIAYGLDTNNGGMYIEGDGTFYTYERTPAESIYSLEELFRHEGVHYLQGRYMVPGSWGASPIYDGNRMTWFEEGGAEWHAGATRAAGIKSRPTKTRYIPADAAARMSISTLIHTGYGSWDFYDYGCNLMDFLYNNGRQDSHLNLAAAIRQGNTATFDALASGLTANESAYQGYLTTLLNNSGTFSDPSTSPDYLAAHPEKSLASVQSEITAATGLTGVSVSSTKDTDGSTFTLRGTCTGSASAGTLPDWTAMSARVDGWLGTLAANGWSGYKTLTAYFVNKRKDASNRVQYDVVFHGVCTDPAVSNNQNPKAVITAPAAGTPNKPTSFSGSASSDPDGSIVSYLWDFADGTTATGVTVSKTYAKPGIYAVKLTVTDNVGATNTVTATIKQEFTDAITAEWEPNDTAATACGPLGSGVAVSGSLSASDNKDFFFFDAKSAGDIAITFAATGANSCTWQLFHESDLATPVAYMTDPTTVAAIPATRLGRYFLMAYTYGAGNGYTLTATGSPLGTAPATAPRITTQPQSQNVTAGTAATFRVVASGTGLAYQWRRNGEPITGATSDTYTTPATTSADNNAAFSVVVSNSAGSVASSNATLTVTGAGPDTTAPALNLVITAVPGTATCDPNATDNVGVAKVVYWVDNNTAVEVAAKPFALAINTSAMTPGSTHQVYGRAYDAAGNNADSGWKSFNVVAASGGPDTQAPTITASAVAGTNGSVTYSANASDNVGIAKVIFYTDNWNTAATDTASPWTATRTGLSKGTHYVLAEARDAANNVAYTSWISFVIP